MHPCKRFFYFLSLYCCTSTLKGRYSQLPVLKLIRPDVKAIISSCSVGQGGPFANNPANTLSFWGPQLAVLAPIEDSFSGDLKGCFTNNYSFINDKGQDYTYRIPPCEKALPELDDISENQNTPSPLAHMEEDSPMKELINTPPTERNFFFPILAATTPLTSALF